MDSRCLFPFIFSIVGICLVVLLYEYRAKLVALKNLDYIDRVVGEYRDEINTLKQRRESDIETGMCLWEVICAIINTPPTPGESSEVIAYTDKVEATAKALGMSHLRSIVATWVPLVDRAWELLDIADPSSDGQHLQSFDWEFVPYWIGQNIDWSNPNNPTVKHVEE